MKKLILFTLIFAFLLSVNGANQPNVVLVMTDDQGYGDLSCHGNPVLKTPHLDELYEDSVRLTDYHVAPTCSPTRAALITGHWTNRT
ncbi:sulfatase-like hydrolase/transferase, partial [Verrucomicrobia bacterium]|nr:sulfatase-like hydrolase/transferase [Verrucomicrobiota bacterium]